MTEEGRNMHLNSNIFVLFWIQKKFLAQFLDFLDLFWVIFK